MTARSTFVVGNWKDYSPSRPGRVERQEGAAAAAGAEPMTSRRQSLSTSTYATFSKRYLMATAQRHRPSPRREDRNAAVAGGERQHPKRPLWLAPNQSGNCFAADDPPAERRAAGSIFCCFASHALRAYTVGVWTPKRAFSTPSRNGGGTRARYTATERSTSDAYESGVYGVLNAEIIRRKSAVKTATLTTKNYCLVLRRRRTSENMR